MSETSELVLELPSVERRIYCNRTLNLRAIRAVGFDMDYTLVHYKVEEWERHAYEHARKRLIDRGWPLENLAFDPSFVILGLILDLWRGNIVKASRFGYITRAYHGTHQLDFDRQRELYSRVLVDLHDPRWVFLNTLFSLSEAMLYAQCVELLDEGKLELGVGYTELYRIVRGSVDATHTEGVLKAEIGANPDRFVELDPELPLALMDLKYAGKLVLLVTNSEWSYTRAIMEYAFERYLPSGTRWRDVFDLVVVAARKPEFFTDKSPAFEVVSDDGLLRPSDQLKLNRAYHGGNARMVERDLSLSPEEILYIGDHLYSDVHVTKDLLRWRTALVVRNLEHELSALAAFEPKQLELGALMAEKERLEHAASGLRLRQQRIERGYGPDAGDAEQIQRSLSELKARLSGLDHRIQPLASEAGELFNRRWGLMMRAGIDKSYLARQLERYADAYMSRVSNLLHYTPFVYLRAPRVSLPHDAAPGGDV